MAQSHRRAFIIALSLLAFQAALSAAFYYGLTNNFAGANDFYVPWRATQALLLERRDPYSTEVTRDIQRVLFGAPRAPDQHQFSFAYPLYASLLVAPLVALPYDAAQAIWQAALFTLILGAGLLCVRNLGIQLKPLPLALIAVWLVSFYPSARSLILGQMAVIVFACTVGAWWAARAERDGLAGALLALTTIKPQMVFLWLPLVLWWALQQRRTRLVWGFALTLGALLGVSLAAQPTWPVAFAQATATYTAYFDSQSPLQIALGNDALGLAASALLVAVLALAAWRAPNSADERLRLLLWALIVTQLVALHTATTNQVLLVIPILAGSARLPSQPAMWSALSLLLFLFAPWLIFFATLQGNQESAQMLLPLSLGVAIWWLILDVRHHILGRRAVPARI